MIIDTETLDTRELALKVLKRGGMDWIDTPAEELWEGVAAEERQQKTEWREEIIRNKTNELNGLLKTLEDIIE